MTLRDLNLKDLFTPATPGPTLPADWTPDTHGAWEPIEEAEDPHGW